MNLPLKRIDAVIDHLYKNEAVARVPREMPRLRLVRKAAAKVDVFHDHSPLRRMFDVFFAAAGLLFSAPLLACVAAVIRATSSGPAFIRQTRLTLNSKPFTLYKFRTMYADAEAQSGPVFSEENDPRVTPVGRILRKTRIDEIPQLWNVLRGEMSVVGPRPERPEMVALLAEELKGFRRRLSVKAGITGLAQIEAGYSSSVETYRRKLALDILYIKNRSLLLDLSILIRTVAVVVLGKGAR